MDTILASDRDPFSAGRFADPRHRGRQQRVSAAIERGELAPRPRVPEPHLTRYLESGIGDGKRDELGAFPVERQTTHTVRVRTQLV